MKTLFVPYIHQHTDNIENVFVALKKTPAILININNWKINFTYEPFCQVQIAWHESGFYLHYEVKESHVLTTQKGITGNVWKDSCVEFFMSLDNGFSYYNFECNAVGSRLLNYKNGQAKKESTQEVLEKIIVQTSLPLFTNLDIKEETHWSLSAFLPVHLFNGLTLSVGKKMRGNFYKCGDQTTQPHYLSWTTIHHAKPNFHLPEFFGYLELT